MEKGLEEAVERGLDAGEIREFFHIEKKDIRSFSPLTMAFIGDAVYDLIIRSMLVEGGNRGVEGLHKDKSMLVNANAQAAMAEHFLEILKEEELEIYRWGKNAKTNSHAKNASIRAYHKATGFEALIGYLYMTGENERLLEIIKQSLNYLETIKQGDSQ